MSFALRHILTHPESITPEAVKEITTEIMAGKLSPSQIGAFLTSLKLLGLETNPHYITAVAKAMRDAALPIAFPANLTIVVPWLR